MNTVSKLILFLGFGGALHAQTQNWVFSNWVNDYSNHHEMLGGNGGGTTIPAGPAAFDFISGNPSPPDPSGGPGLLTGTHSFSGGAVGGVLIPNGAITPSVDLNTHSFSMSGKFRSIRRNMIPAYFGLSATSDAETLNGTGFSDTTAGSANGPGASYWGGSLRAFNDTSDPNDPAFQINARQYDNDTDTFSQNVLTGANLLDGLHTGVVLNFSVDISYNGIGTITVVTNVADETTPNAIETISRNFGGLNDQEVSALNPFLRFYGGSGSGGTGVSGGFLTDVSTTLVPVPEPSSALLSLLGSVGLLIRRRR